MEKKFQWTIKEVASWASDKSIVQIPTIQRGLVWKPQQVELLWDSILRHFPIGAFTLSESSSEDNPYNLLDGQQRWNAISLGFDKAEEMQFTRAIIWLDIKPEAIWDKKKTTRKFFVRVTTKAHPWGYWSDDECSRLNTSQKRDAVLEYGLFDKNIYHDGISLSQTYPARSGYPIPINWLLEAGERASDEDGFVEMIQQKIEENVNTGRYKLKDGELPQELLKKYYSAFHEVCSYVIPTIYLEQDVIDTNGEKSDVDNETQLSDIEVLFARIGTGGTPITQNELIYSTIKAYWPKELTRRNDVLASKYMPSFSLIMLAFRLALSPSKDGGLISSPSIKRVREIALQKDEDYQKIIKLYQEDSEGSLIESILGMVNKWLTNDSDNKGRIPPVLRTSIARNSPEVFLLLMYFAKESITNKVEYCCSDENLFRALAFYIHWMVDKGSRNWLVSKIFRAIINQPAERYHSIIKSVILESYHWDAGAPMIPEDQFESLFGERLEVGKDSQWRPWDEDRVNKPWWYLWSRVCSEREILLYAQRTYLCDKFPNYDPSKMDMWEEYNRPWDYDHIIPQDWIYQYRAWKKPYSDYCNTWKDGNGNMAAIPFEVNRSKSNASDWSEYIEEKTKLLADDEIERYHDIFTSEITSDATQSYLFAKKSYIRLCKIYSEIYRLFLPINVNVGQTELIYRNDLETRRRRMTEISSALHTSVYYLYNKEYPVQRAQDWTKKWLSTGILTSNGYYAAITMEVSGNDLHLSGRIEIGLRRFPGLYEFPKKEISQETLDKLNQVETDFKYWSESAPWWYVHYDLPIGTSDDKLIEYLNRLARFAEDNLKEK